MMPQTAGNTLVVLWRAWRTHTQQRHLAAQFTERDLRDLGLTRGDLHRALDGSGWRRMIR